MTGSYAPWPIATLGSGADEAAQRDEPRRPRPARAERERVAHDGALRKAPENRPLPRQVEPVEPRRDVGVRRREGRGVREADLVKRIPVRPARRERERTARRDPEQTPPGVEGVQQREQVVLVRAASVEEDERTLRVARGLPNERSQRLAQLSRGFWIGVRSGSTCSRRCSNAGGSDRRSPSDSRGSSAVNPGPSVAISNSTPLGSRK